MGILALHSYCYTQLFRKVHIFLFSFSFFGVLTLSLFTNYLKFPSLNLFRHWLSLAFFATFECMVQACCALTLLSNKSMFRKQSESLPGQEGILCKQFSSLKIDLSFIASRPQKKSFLWEKSKLTESIRKRKHGECIKTKQWWVNEFFVRLPGKNKISGLPTKQFQMQ